MKINFKRHDNVYENLTMFSESLADAAKLVELSQEMQNAENIYPVLQTTVPKEVASAVPFAPKMADISGLVLTVGFNTRPLIETLANDIGDAHEAASKNFTKLSRKTRAIKKKLGKKQSAKKRKARK